MSGTSDTMKPVRPCSTISGSAPDRKATTGVPQAKDSIATSELVSATVLGMTRHLAWDSRSFFSAEAKGPDEAAQFVEAGCDFVFEILQMGFVREDLARQQELHSGLVRCVQGEVKALLRADSSHGKNEIALECVSVETVDIDSVGDGFQEVGRARAGLVLRPGNTVHPEVLAAGSEDAARVPIWGQVQGRQDGDIGGRDVTVEVQAMHVDEVHAVLGEDLADQVFVDGAGPVAD